MLARRQCPSVHRRSWSSAPAAVRARQVVCSSRKQKHQQSKTRQQQQSSLPEQHYYLPTSAEQSLESIYAAQDAAEAAQQQLRSSDPFAAAADVSPTLRSILDIYRDVQQLYHKTIKTVMQQHPDLATSPAGGAQTAGQPLFPAFFESCMSLCRLHVLQRLHVLPVWPPPFGPHHTRLLHTCIIEP